MLFIFRKLRRSFFPLRQKEGSAGHVLPGKVRTYVAYAIGEIVLIVVGILIALQIGERNAGRKDRAKELDILRSLAKNLEINIQTFEANIEALHDYNKSSEIVLKTLDEKLPYTETLNVHFHKARVSKDERFISQTGYEQFKNAGFSIVRNDRLKDEVIGLFESTYPRNLLDYDQVNKEYVPVVDHIVPLFIYAGDSKGLEPVDFEALYDDNYYINWIRAYMKGRKDLITIETDVSSETQKVLNLLQAELNKK
ncbi:MAG: hypothetical protein O3C43_17795 [Verrucomicrobia bacterium]|nr:hypothetical protein [Verrucomicrobiota bacterium]MDA1068345.1 hypothetical protein [Verrucomicrobiota bacterium]